MYTGILSFTQGDYFQFTGIASDINGNTLNLSGMSGAGYIKVKYGDRGILDQFNFSVTNSSSGYYSVYLPPANTAAFPVCQGVYGIYVFTSGLNTNPYQAQIAQGYINIFPEMVSTFTELFTGINTGNNCWSNIDGGSF